MISKPLLQYLSSHFLPVILIVSNLDSTTSTNEFCYRCGTWRYDIDSLKDCVASKSKGFYDSVWECCTTLSPIQEEYCKNYSVRIANSTIAQKIGGIERPR